MQRSKFIKANDKGERDTEDKFETFSSSLGRSVLELPF